MDIFDFDNVKAEKANAMLRYCRLRSIAKLFRFVELCLALVFLSWISARLPFAVKISSEYFRQLSATIASPIFVFVVVNVIILTLLANSSRFSGSNLAGNDAESELYEECVKNSETRTSFGSENHSLSHETEDIVYQDKHLICEVNTISHTCENKEVAMVVTNTETEKKVYRRIQSEKLRRKCSERPSAMLRRSETEKLRKIVSSGEGPAEDLYPLDELSNEEFQCMIDKFIAKQMKFHRQEYLSVALQSQS